MSEGWLASREEKAREQELHERELNERHHERDDEERARQEQAERDQNERDMQSTRQKVSVAIDALEAVYLHPTIDDAEVKRLIEQSYLKLIEAERILYDRIWGEY